MFIHILQTLSQSFSSWPKIGDKGWLKCGPSACMGGGGRAYDSSDPPPPPHPLATGLEHPALYDTSLEEYIMTTSELETFGTV